MRGPFTRHPGPLRRGRDWSLHRVDRSRRNDEVVGTHSGHPPAVVVHEQMMMSAEQYPVSDVGSAVIPLPLVDVMRLGPPRWPIAVGEPAATIAGGESDSLPVSEQPLCAPDI